MSWASRRWERRGGLPAGAGHYSGARRTVNTRFTDPGGGAVPVAMPVGEAPRAHRWTPLPAGRRDGPTRIGGCPMRIKAQCALKKGIGAEA
jgi:hypothetical protein